MISYLRDSDKRRSNSKTPHTSSEAFRTLGLYCQFKFLSIAQTIKTFLTDIPNNTMRLASLPSLGVVALVATTTASQRHPLWPRQTTNDTAMQARENLNYPAHTINMPVSPSPSPSTHTFSSGAKPDQTKSTPPKNPSPDHRSTTSPTPPATFPTPSQLSPNAISSTARTTPPAAQSSSTSAAKRAERPAFRTYRPELSRF